MSDENLRRMWKLRGKLDQLDMSKMQSEDTNLYLDAFISQYGVGIKNAGFYLGRILKVITKISGDMVDYKRHGDKDFMPLLREQTFVRDQDLESTPQPSKPLPGPRLSLILCSSQPCPGQGGGAPQGAGWRARCLPPGGPRARARGQRRHFVDIRFAEVGREVPVGGDTAR